MKRSQCQTRGQEPQWQRHSSWHRSFLAVTFWLASNDYCIQPAHASAAPSIPTSPSVPTPSRWMRLNKRHRDNGIEPQTQYISHEDPNWLLRTLAMHNQHQYPPESRRAVWKRVRSAATSLPWQEWLVPDTAWGVYYGLSSKLVAQQYKDRPRSVGWRETLAETLQEVKSLRQDLQALRQELASMKQTQGGAEVIDNEALARREEERKAYYQTVSQQLETWALEQFQINQAKLEPLSQDADDDMDDGWAEVQCSRMLRNKFNADGRTRAFLKWMPDSRGDPDDSSTSAERNENKGRRNKRADDVKLYPCIQMFSTLDAPLEEACRYLANPTTLNDYNDLLDQHKDLQILTPDSKICWGQTPAVLFIKPRQLITFCVHKWQSDGTQLILNQACFDEHLPTSQKASAHCLRGATILSRHPDFPETQTRIAMMAHAKPGDDIPDWACQTAIKALAPIEPFKLMSKINKGILEASHDSEPSKAHSPLVVGQRTQRPGGLSMMGFACYWPEGGGMVEAAENIVDLNEANVDNDELNP